MPSLYYVGKDCVVKSVREEKWSYKQPQDIGLPILFIIKILFEHILI